MFEKTCIHFASVSREFEHPEMELIIFLHLVQAPVNELVMRM